MKRFVAILAPTPERSPIAPAIRGALSRTEGLSVMIDRDDMLVAGSDGHIRQLGDDIGIIIGPIFATGKSDPVTLPSDFAPGGEPVELDRFSQDHWGNFVTILRDGAAGFHVLRSAFGRLPCFHAMQDDQLICASDTSLLTLAGWTSRRIDWSGVLRRLALKDIPSPSTCLAGVQELRGGSRLHLTAKGLSVAQTWNPWDRAGRRHWIDDRDEAPRMVRRAVSTATRASIMGADRALLMLSGGIDSSVLAAALGTHGCPFACFNLASLGTVGDERRYAQMVASHMGASIMESQWDVGMVDITRSHAINHPNPIARSFMQGTSRLLGEAVETSGADLTIDGGGGDNVFFSLRSIAPVTDAFLRGGSLSEGWSTTLSIAAMADVSAFTVLGRAAARAFRRSPAYRWRPMTQYLSPEVMDDEALVPRHPWLEPPCGGETGTAAHIALITAAQGWAEGNDIRSPVRHVTPLASQPVVEACLRIPSWWWFRHGQNRIVARDAFRDRLPAPVVNRRTKGTPDSYIAEIFTANRPVIRAMLLDGHLRRAGLLDIPLLERALDSEGPVQGTHYHRIMHLADVEAWIAGQV
ncbi:asparagine synthetase B family protein [Sphingobium sp. EM0848]|uniref:asparagine synthase-related protein n=1 Tax=Sphingobium sp. EM0848 TaxID=2743473 RepID=UPI00159C30C0|nr:asparagine synthetase B family protein [Sphingobium sp. EM0848]